LSLAPRKTLLVTKSEGLRSGSTPWAQGGVAFPVDSEDVPVHVQDTYLCGDRWGNLDSIQFLVENALPALGWLEELGFAFDRDAGGEYLRGQEGAHSRRRILHANGDSTGAALFEFFQKKILAAPHVTLRTTTCAVEAVVNDGITGLWLWDKEGPLLVKTSRVVLATGGYGQVFAKTTAPEESTGDGTALALRAGVRLRDAEMIQFHPTGLGGVTSHQVPLLTEALRGDGALLVTSDDPHKNSELKPLAVPHPLGALGPRDLVARTVYERLQAGYPVWLDVRKVPRLNEHFPTACSLTRQNGFEPQTELLPVVPVAHYVMGGVFTDLAGHTTVPGLYAVGEAASTGVHGANRLASNSLLECLVFGRECARTLLSESSLFAPPPHPAPELRSIPDKRPSKVLSQDFRRRIQDIVFGAAGPIREASVLKKGLEKLTALERQWIGAKQTANLHGTLENDFGDFRSFLETENLFLIAQTLLTSALKNTASRGAHYRMDAVS
jgi:L-aspartate oxidase